MFYYRYSGTETGFYCIVFDVYTNKTHPDALISDTSYQLALDTEVRDIADDEKTAHRVKRSLVRILGLQGLRDVRYVLASGNPENGLIALRYVCRAFRDGTEILRKKADPDIQAFDRTVRQVSYEIERMKGFLRFRKLPGDLFYASFEPDNDITHLLLPYFAARMNTVRFLIHDKRHGKVGMYNGTESTVVDFDGVMNLPEPCGEDPGILRLWCEYYRNVTLNSRKNQRLQDGWLPRRYRKNMPETLPEALQETLLSKFRQPSD